MPGGRDREQPLLNASKACVCACTCVSVRPRPAGRSPGVCVLECVRARVQLLLSARPPRRDMPCCSRRFPCPCTPQTRHPQPRAPSPARSCPARGACTPRSGACSTPSPTTTRSSARCLPPTRTTSKQRRRRSPCPTRVGDCLQYWMWSFGVAGTAHRSWRRDAGTAGCVRACMPPHLLVALIVTCPATSSLLSRRRGVDQGARVRLQAHRHVHSLQRSHVGACVGAVRP